MLGRLRMPNPTVEEIRVSGIKALAGWRCEGEAVPYMLLYYKGSKSSRSQSAEFAVICARGTVLSTVLYYIQLIMKLLQGPIWLIANVRDRA